MWGRGWTVAATVLWLAAGSGSSAQFRGLGRMTGMVTDESGMPLKDVSVRGTLAGQTGTLEEKTDVKGWWALNGVAKGDWHVTFQAPGYAPVVAHVVLHAELEHVAPMTVVLKESSTVSHTH